MAMKKAKSKGETEVLANTMIFMGNYSKRTKFFMESISYFENAIAIAEKEQSQKNNSQLAITITQTVYSNLGNLKEHRECTAETNRCGIQRKGYHVHSDRTPEPGKILY